MSVPFVARLFSLAVVLAAVMLVLGAGMGSASHEPAAPPVKAADSVAVKDAWGGRLCPREVGYGKYDQPITLQDI